MTSPAIGYSVLSKLNGRSLSSNRKAELVLAAYDLLLADNSNKDSVIRLVKAA